MAEQEFTASVSIKAKADEASFQSAIKEAKAMIKKAEAEKDAFTIQLDAAEKKNKKTQSEGTTISVLKDNINKRQAIIESANQKLLTAQKAYSQALLQDRKNLYTQLRKINQQMSSMGISDTDTQKLKDQRAQIQRQLGGNTAKIKSLGDSGSIAASQEMSKQYQTLKMTDTIQQNINRNAQQIKEAYRMANEYAREMASNEQKIAQLEKTQGQGTDNSLEIEQLKKNNEEVEKLRNEKMKILSQDKDLLNSATEIEQRYKRQTDAIKSQNASLEDTVSFSEKLKKSVENIARYVIMYKVLNAIEQATRSAIQTVIDLDTAFTDIQLVTGETDEQIQQLSEDYNDLAKQMGSTTQEVAEGASEWLRQGKSVEETSQLLKASMTLSKVGAIESSEATSLLTSTLNGFKLEAQDAMTVVDKISAIDMAAATSSEELMTALSRTANSADDAGISFDKLLAMIGTVSSVTRKSASTIGESFKTIFSRMSNVAAGKDIDEEGESLNDVEESLGKVGIALRDSQDEWRNFEDVLDEVAQKWDSFTSTQQSQVATAIAGTRQQENFRALMNNWDQVNEMMGVAENSSGTATERMDIYLDSIEAKLSQLKATWEDFILSLQQSDSLKTLIDMGIWAIENLPSLIGYISALVVLFKGDKVVSGIAKLVSGISGLSNPIVALKDNLQILALGWTRNADGMLEVADAARTTAAAMSVLKVGVSAVIAIVSLAFQAYNSWKQSQYEAGQEAREEADTYEQTATSLENLKNQYIEVANSVMDASEKKDTLTSLQSQLNDAYGEEKNNIDLVNQSYEKNLKLLDEKIEKEKSLELSQLKVSAEAGESNLDNWTNLVNDIDLNQGISKEDNETVVKALEKIAGGDITFTTGEYAHSDSGTSGYIYRDGSEVIEEEIKGIRSDAHATNEETLKYAQEIEMFLEDNVDNLTQDTKDTLTAFVSKLRDEVDEKAPDQYDNKQAYQLALFEKDNSDAISEYEDNLKKQKELQEKYTNATSESQKESYKKQLAEQEKITEESLNNITKLYNSEDKNQSTLSEGIIKKALESTESSVSSLYSVLDEKQGEKLFDLTEELYKSNNLTDELKTKILEMRDAIAQLGNEDALEEFDSQLESMGIKINENAEKWAYLKNALTANTTEYNIDDSGNIISESAKTDYEKFLDIESDLDDLLKADGIKFSDSWYNSLKEQLQKGEISGKQFFDTLSQGAKAFGVDINNAISQVGELNEPDIPVLGTQKDFVDQMGKVDEMYSDAANIKEGNSLDNQRIVDLRNEYEELNDYIAETGDLTFKNGQMLVDIANQTYDDGTTAIENQISALDDYQDAILNTVDAMGIMSEYQEELKKIDEDLADTITDDAVKEANAKGQFADISETTADGIYNANEDIQDSEGKTYSLLEAYARGIIDTKDDEANAKVQAAKDSIQALYDEANVSEEAYTLSSDYIEQNRQALLDKGWTEEQITDAKTKLAGIQVDADGNIALAAQDQAATTQDAELATAKAFVSVTLAAISTANSIASLFGIQSETLTQAQKDLEDAQATISEVEQNKQDQAKNAALMTAEIEARKKELEARRNQITSARNIGGKNYSSAGNKSGSSSKSDAEKLQEDIDKFREEEGTDLEDVTEELINHYKLEKSKLELQKKNLDYANDLVDAEENTTQWIKVQNQLLTNQRKQIQEVYRTNSKIEQQLEKIQSENPQYDINSWFDDAGNDTLDYINLINSFAQQERDYRASVSINSEEDLKNAEAYIDKLKEQREYVENLHDSVSKLKDAWLDNGEELQDLFSEMNDTLKDMRDTLLDKFMTALEDRVEEVNDVYQDNIDKLDSLITIQEKYNDVINDSLDTQADIRKELQSNKDSYQYLDDYMRSIIFNEDDYKKLSGQLDSVMSDMNALSDEYQYKINNLTEDEMYMIDEITNEYERQVEIKEKEYEILKAQLDVVKARTQLENARNERTVRMFVGGQWQWVKRKLTLYSNIY